jgi:hypothetical protein
MAVLTLFFKLVIWADVSAVVVPDESLLGRLAGIRKL